jgi:DNA invertase Pin-like site-specific DNA recombinase
MMTNTKLAVGYVCDIQVAGTDIIITKADQRDRIRKYAAKQNIDLVGFFEDEADTPDFLRRPGVQNMLNLAPAFEQVIVERVWALTRDASDIEQFLNIIEKKDVKLIATSNLWDAASKLVRHRYYALPAYEQRKTVKRNIHDVKNCYRIGKDFHLVQAA